MTELPNCYRCDWHGCYDGSWKGLIVEEAFTHPAKYARGLICRIVGHGIEKGYWAKGDLIGDPFAGIGTGGIIAASNGLRWIGVELEQNFVDLAKQNFDLHRRTWEGFGDPQPVIVQGDSCEFARLVAEQIEGCVTSPPYSEQMTDASGNRIDYSQAKEGGKSKTISREGFGKSFGTTPGQIGSLPAGQIGGALQAGDASAIVPVDTCDTSEEQTSPGGTSADSPLASVQPSGLAAQGECDEDVLGMDRRLLRGGGVRDVVQGQTKGSRRSGGRDNDRPEGKGATGIDPAISPQAPDRRPDLLAETVQEQISQVGHNGDMGVSDHPQGRHRSVPAESDSVPDRKAIKSHDSLGATDITEAEQECRCGEGCQSAGRRDADSQNSEAHGVRLPQGTRRTGKGGETYWEACAKVYSECHKAIRPNGVLVLVLKDYVSKGKRVPLCDDTCKLLESLDFHVFERTR
ncbi:hypothetical protein LCGC14_1515480, partial [marine sediment metagenome]